MQLPSSPPPSMLSAFVGLLKFVVGCLLSYWDPLGRWTEVRSSPGSCKHKLRTPDVVGQKRFLLGTGLKKLLNNDSSYACLSLMLLPSSPPPSTLSAFVGLLKFVVGRLLSYWDPYVIGQKRFLLGTGLKNASTTTRLMTANNNKTPDVDSQSILPAATVSYTVHVPKRAEEVDEAMPSFENEEKRHVSDCFKSIKPSSPLSLSCLSLMLLPSSPPPSTLSAFVGLLKFVVGRLLSYWDPHVVGQKRFLLGTDLKNASTTTQLMTASSNKTPDVDSQSILPEATVSYTVMCPREPKKLMKQCQALKTKKRGT
ncbi:hypothetical protein F2Q69_00054571 [Brassica cretica]|uniref:Uncharacterized protein n=1 Tax=Brassica cretica TaxID=69181 RepID=A0A8S9MTF7_BRACR|nr:hypothetical protein F2Q69_00054571 [Brassica cretica]